MKRYRDVILAGAIACVLAVWAAPALSHHSMAMFVRENPITIEGTLTEVAWANPHSLFFVEGKPTAQPAATVRSWSVEAPASRQLIALGWQKDTIKPGAKVKVKGFWRKDQRPQLLFIEIADENGHHFTTEKGE
jgi:hypothetical protein